MQYNQVPSGKVCGGFPGSRERNEYHAQSDDVHNGNSAKTYLRRYRYENKDLLQRWADGSRNWKAIETITKNT